MTTNFVQRRTKFVPQSALYAQGTVSIEGGGGGSCSGVGVDHIGLLNPQASFGTLTWPDGGERVVFKEFNSLDIFFSSCYLPSGIHYPVGSNLNQVIIIKTITNTSELETTWDNLRNNIPKTFPFSHTFSTPLPKTLNFPGGSTKVIFKEYVSLSEVTETVLAELLASTSLLDGQVIVIKPVDSQVEAYRECETIDGTKQLKDSVPINATDGYTITTEFATVITGNITGDISGGIVNSTSGTFGNLVITGNLTVNGTESVVNTEILKVDQGRVEMGLVDGLPPVIVTDTNDMGNIMHYCDIENTPKIAFMGYDKSAEKFTIIPDASETDNVMSGEVGTLVANIEGIIGGDDRVPAAVTGTTITANAGFTGDLSGDVIGNVSGNVVGDLTGNVISTVQPDITTMTGLTSFGDVDMITKAEGDLDIAGKLTSGDVTIGNVTAGYYTLPNTIGTSGQIIAVSSTESNKTEWIDAYTHHIEAMLEYFKKKIIVGSRVSNWHGVSLVPPNVSSRNTSPPQVIVYSLLPGLVTVPGRNDVTVTTEDIECKTINIIGGHGGLNGTGGDQGVVTASSWLDQSTYPIIYETNYKYEPFNLFNGTSSNSEDTWLVDDNQKGHSPLQAVINNSDNVYNGSHWVQIGFTSPQPID